MLFGRPPLLAQCVDLDVRLYYAAVQNLAYGYGNIPQTTAVRSDTPPIHCDQHMQQSVDMSIELPAGLQCDPVQMTELRQQVQRCLGQSIAGWHSAPLWLFACENTRLRCRQRGVHCVLMWLFGHPLLLHAYYLWSEFINHILLQW